MENFDFISKLLDGRIVLGEKMLINDGLYIIPVYKAKVSFLTVKTDIKSNNGDGLSGNLNVTPICILKVLNSNIEIINLEELDKKEGIMDVIPNMLNNIDVNNILKNLKI